MHPLMTNSWLRYVTGLSIAGRVGIGAAKGVGGFLVEAGSFVVLSGLTFGVYGTHVIGESIYAGYQEAGALGAVNAVNPLYAIAKAGVMSYLAAERGDYEAAGEAGANATMQVLSAAVVGGLASKAAPGAVGAGAAEAGASAAPKAYSVAFETTIPKRGIGTYRSHFTAANENLLWATASPELANALRQALGTNFEGTILSGSGYVLGRSPAGWTWHHVPNQPGVLQLVPLSQHAPGSAFQGLLHPGGIGGMTIWGQLY
jgi:hypothetical protein